MNGGYREPDQRVVDVTEIERAKIHEEAETKRKLIEEREETRRQNRWSNDSRTHVSVAAALAAAAIGITVALAHANYVSVRYPAPPRACREFDPSASSTPSVCDPGGHLVFDDHGKRCVCDRPATASSGQ